MESGGKYEDFQYPSVMCFVSCYNHLKQKVYRNDPHSLKAMQIII